MAEEDLVVPDYSQEQQQQPAGSSALSDEDPPELADNQRFVVVMQNGRLLAGLSMLVGLLILALGFGGDGPPSASPDRASQPHPPLHSAWPSDWYVSAQAETSTGDGRPIGDLQAGTRGEACSGRNGAVAATNFQATQAGLAVLANGGNAADAAVAVQLALGVAQPESTGLGGGCFIVVYEAATGEVVTIDGREEAPAAFHRHVYCADKSCGEDPACTSCPGGALGFRDRFTGGLAVGVPGTLAAAMRLLSDHGTRSFADVAAPAIDLARGGITMTNHLFNALRGSISRLALWPASAALFLNPERTDPVAAVGELWHNPDLADTYEHLAEQGWEDFYSGELAQEVVDAVRNATNPNSERGGLMDLADISGYKAVKRAPTRVNFTNAQRETFEIFGMGMPSSGGATMGMIFNLLEAASFDGSYTSFAFDSTRTHTPGETRPVEPPTCNLRGAHNPCTGTVVDNSGDGPCDGDPCPACAEAPTCPVLFDHCTWDGDCNTPPASGPMEQCHGAQEQCEGPCSDPDTLGVATWCPAADEAACRAARCDYFAGGDASDTSPTASTANGESGMQTDDAASGWAPGVDYTTLGLHALNDVQNIAFADRNKYMGDADFINLPIYPFTPRDGGLLSKEYARQRWAEHGGATQSKVPYGIPPDYNVTLGPGSLEYDQGTTHFVVVDKDKNVVSWTTTIESNMGSSVVVPGRGFPLNNELTDFDSTSEDADGNPNANAPEGGKMPRRTALYPEERILLGGKRPRSSMSPTIILKDGEPHSAIGCPGGSTIIGAVSNALLGRIMHNLPLQTAVDLPRIIARNTGSASIEEALCSQWPDVCSDFEDMGYRYSARRPGTLVQALEITADGSFVAAADTKRIDSGACGAL